MDRKGKNAIVLTLEDSATKPDDEPTPFKRVMSEKGKKFGKDISVNAAEESMPVKEMAKGGEKIGVACHG